PRGASLSPPGAPPPSGASAAAASSASSSSIARRICGGTTETTVSSEGVRIVVFSGAVSAATLSESPTPRSLMSASMELGTSCGRHSTWRVHRWCSTTPPSLTPCDSPARWIGTSTVIFSSRAIRRKSTWRTVPRMWSRWTSRGMASIWSEFTRRSTRTFIPASVWRRWNSSLASTVTDMASAPCPYTTAGTRPAERIFRATPLPVASRGSAFSLGSIVVPPGPQLGPCSTRRRRLPIGAGQGHRRRGPSGLVVAVEDLGDRLVLEHGQKSGGDDRRDGEHRQPVAQDLHLLLGDRQRVRDHGLLDRGLDDALHGLAREDRVGRDRVDHLCPFCRQRSGRIGHRPPRVDHVVDQHARPASDVADHAHLLDLVRLVPRPSLVDEHQVGAKVLAKALRNLDPAGVWCHDDDVLRDADLL